MVIAIGLTVYVIVMNMLPISTASMMMSSLSSYALTITPPTNTTTNNNIMGGRVENATTHTAFPSMLDLSTGNKTFYLVNQEIANFNETKMGFPADIYSRPVLIVNKGDNVTIHFFNIEDKGGDRHSFTLAAPYYIDKDLTPGQNVTATFRAEQQGVFIYYCKYHMPSMTGELMVLPK